MHWVWLLRTGNQALAISFQVIMASALMFRVLQALLYVLVLVTLFFFLSDL
jgi:hypothetical protein